MVLSVTCKESPQLTEKTSNSDYEVSLLFEYDGCKIYSFHDGRTIHYVVCNKGGANVDVVVNESHTRSCGKGCTKVEHTSLPAVIRAEEE